MYLIQECRYFSFYPLLWTFEFRGRGRTCRSPPQAPLYPRSWNISFFLSSFLNLLIPKEGEDLPNPPAPRCPRSWKAQGRYKVKSRKTIFFEDDSIFHFHYSGNSKELSSREKPWSRIFRSYIVFLHIKVLAVDNMIFLVFSILFLYCTFYIPTCYT